MVRFRSSTPATPSPDTGGAEATDQPVSIVVNNYYNVGDDSNLVAERSEYLARQRAQRPSAGAPSGYPPPANRDRHTKAVGNWKELSQAVFFRSVQRVRCRELQKLWEACMKLRHRLETHPWEATRSSSWAREEGFKGKQPKNRLSQKPSRAKGGKTAESTDEEQA